MPFVLMTQLRSLVGAEVPVSGPAAGNPMLCSENWPVKTSDSELWWWEGQKDPLL